MSKTMKPRMTTPPTPKMSEEQIKEQAMRAYVQKKASLAEAILFNMMHNPNLDMICGGKSPVEAADSMAEEFMKVVYLQEVKPIEKAEE